MTTPATRFGLPADAQIVMAAGDYLPGDGLRLSVWAFDVLKYLAPKLHLVLVGDGPERERNFRMVWAVGFDDLRVHALLDVSPLSAVADADLVWGTHPAGGIPFLQAALDHGKPVLAMRTPETESLPGLILTPLGDPVALATATRKILSELVLRL
jgi:glycosyltransferase involved in cell wall biosynthesis